MKEKRRFLVLLAIMLLSATASWAQDAQYVTAPVRGHVSSILDVFSCAGDVHQFWIPDGSTAGGWKIISVVVATGRSLLGTGRTVEIASVWRGTSDAAPGQRIELTHESWAFDHWNKSWFTFSIKVATSAPAVTAAFSSAETR